MAQEVPAVKQPAAKGGNKEPAKTSIVSSGSKQEGSAAAAARKPDALTNANLGLPATYDPSDASRYPNNSGSAVSPSNPNYPYRPDGTLIVSPTNVSKDKQKGAAPKN